MYKVIFFFPIVHMWNFNFNSISTTFQAALALSALSHQCDSYYIFAYLSIFYGLSFVLLRVQWNCIGLGKGGDDYGWEGRQSYCFMRLVQGQVFISLNKFNSFCQFAVVSHFSYLRRGRGCLHAWLSSGSLYTVSYLSLSLCLSFPAWIIKF